MVKYLIPTFYTAFSITPNFLELIKESPIGVISGSCYVAFLVSVCQYNDKTLMTLSLTQSGHRVLIWLLTRRRF